MYIYIYIYIHTYIHTYIYIYIYTHVIMIIITITLIMINNSSNRWDERMLGQPLCGPSGTLTNMRSEGESFGFLRKGKRSRPWLLVSGKQAFNTLTRVYLAEQDRNTQRLVSGSGLLVLRFGLLPRGRLLLLVLELVPERLGQIVNSNYKSNHMYIMIIIIVIIVIVIISTTVMLVIIVWSWLRSASMWSSMSMLRSWSFVMLAYDNIYK